MHVLLSDRAMEPPDVIITSVQKRVGCPFRKFPLHRRRRPNMSKPLLDIPPVPQNVSTAPLEEVDFVLLAADDPDEAARLFSAARDTGLFYLNLQGTAQGELLLEDAGEMFGLAEKLRHGEDEEREYLRGLPQPDNPFATALVAFNP